MRAIGRILARAKREKGQAAVEFAGAMIPFTLVFLMLVDGGIYFINYVANTNQVREGARCAVVGGSDAAVQAKVGTPPGASGPATVTDRSTSGVGDPVTVSVTWTYEWITPLQLLGLDDETTRTASSTMRLETDDFTTDPCK